MKRLPIKDKEIIDLYESGYSQNDIVKKYAVSVAYTRSVLSEAGFDTSRYRALSPEAIKVIEILRLAGIKYIDIEAICDISFHAIRDYAVRAGINTPEKVLDLSCTYSSFSRFSEFLSAYREGNSFCFLFKSMNIQEYDILPIFYCIKPEDVVKHREGLILKIEKYRADGISDAGITRLLNISRSIIVKGFK